MMDTLDLILKIEQSEYESNKELADLVQPLIDLGLVWQLQGFYGRLAKNLIDAGLCTLSQNN